MAGFNLQLWNVSLSAGPCLGDDTADLVFWYNQKKLLDDLTGLKDQSTTKTHQAQPAGSVEFRGAQHATLASAVTLVGDFSISISLRASSLPEIKALVSGESYDHVIAINTSGNIFVRINNISQTIVLSSVITTTTNIAAVISRSGTVVSYSDSRGATGSVDMGDSSNMVLDTIGDWGGTNNFIGNLWNITASDTTSGTLFDITMSYGEDANIISTVGPDATLVNGLTSDRVESSLFGDDSFNDDGWSEGVTDNVELAEIEADTLGVGWSTPSVGNYIIDGLQVATSALRWNGFVEDGKKYALVFNCQITAGTIRTQGSLYYTAYTSANNGLITEIIDSDSTAFRFAAAVGAAGSIEMVSMQKLPQGKIPADPDNPSQDIYGNALTYPGRASKDANVYGWTIPWNGVAYAPLDETITLSGDFRVELETAITPGTNQYVIRNDSPLNYIRYDGGNLSVAINGVGYTFINVSGFDGVSGLLVVSRVSTSLTVEYKGSTPETVTSSTDDFIIEKIGRAGSSHIGTINYLKFYNASNVLTNHWPIEGRNNVDDEQITLYDVVGGNHATVVSGTVPLFTSPFGGDSGSYVENLITYSEPTELSEITINSNITIETASSDLANFVDNAIVIADNSAERYAYQSVDNSATSRELSFYVEMDDGGVPDPSTASLSGDFCLIMNGSRTGVAITTTLVSGNIYKVSGVLAATGSSASYGLIKYTTQSSRGFKASRRQLTESDGNYIRTDATAIPLTLIPSGGSYLARYGGLTGVADGVEALPNGDFTTDATNWSGTNWAWESDGVSGGRYRHTTGAASSAINNSNSGITTGDVCRVVFTIGGSTAGTINPQLGTTGTGTPVSGNAIHTQELTISGTGTALFMVPTSTFDGYIDVVSIQKITQDIIPYGGSTEPNTFDGVSDAPADVFQVEQVEATLAAYDADQTKFARDPELAPGTSSTLMRKADWTISGEDGTHILTDVTTGVRYQSDTTSPTLSLAKAGVFVIGQQYLLDVDIDVTSGYVITYSAGSALNLTQGTHLITAAATGFDILRGTTDVDVILNSISVKQMTANDTFYNADGTLKLVDPSTIETKGDTQFIGNKAVTVYSANIEGNCLNKTNKYHGL